MGDYYNVTRGPLSVTLNDGSAASVTPKKWFYVTPANEGSASLQQLVSKGFLVRAKVPITQDAPAPVAAVAAVSASEVPASPEKKDEASLEKKGEASSSSAPASAKGERFGGKSR